MKVIYKDAEIQREQEYPNIDILIPIIGLNEGIQFYFIQENIIENPNPGRFNIVTKDLEFTNEVHPDYNHLLICKREMELIEKPQSEIIKRLNDDLGYYLDEVYPLWERNKHLSEFLFEATPERIEYITKLGKWITDCRNERQRREDDYLNENIFPEFNNYPEKP